MAEGRGEPGKSGSSKAGIRWDGRKIWESWTKAGLDDLLEAGQSRTDFVLRFTLSHPGIHTIIVGTMNIEHIKANAKNTQAGPLDNEIYKKAKKLLDSVE